MQKKNTDLSSQKALGGCWCVKLFFWSELSKFYHSLSNLNEWGGRVEVLLKQHLDIFSWSTVGPLYFHPSLLITWRSKATLFTLPETNISLKTGTWKRRFLLESIIFRCYVSLPECTTPLFITVLITSPQFSIGRFFRSMNLLGSSLETTDLCFLQHRKCHLEHLN